VIGGSDPPTLASIAPAYLVGALGATATAEKAAALMADRRSCRTLTSAWEDEPPDVRMLARALQRADDGDSSALRLIQVLHADRHTPAASVTCRRFAALGCWRDRYGDLLWFASAVPLDVVEAPPHDAGDECVVQVENGQECSLVGPIMLTATLPLDLLVDVVAEPADVAAAFVRRRLPT
jgi:hypothetical protein